MPRSDDPVVSTLLWAVRETVAPGRSAPRFAAIDAETWSRILRASVDHNLLPLLDRALAGRDDVPALIREDLARGAAQNQRHNLHLTAELLAVIRRLDRAGIRAVAWKGPLLAQRAYGDVSLRSFFDLDVLVTRVDLPRARDLLLAEGFRPEKPMTARQQETYIDHQGELELVRETDGLWLELHWAVVPNYYAGARTAGDPWARLVRLALLRSSVLALAVEDDLEALCVHGSKHRWDRLLWITDIAMLARAEPGLDWDGLLSRARANGTLRMVRLGLLLARSMAGGPIPARVLRKARGDRGAMTLHAEVSRALFAPRAGRLDAFLFHARMLERGRDRARYALSALFTPSGADWGGATLPPALFPLYSVARPFRLAVKYGRRFVGDAD